MKWGVTDTRTPQMNLPFLISAREVIQRAGISRSHLYALLQRRQFPSPVVRRARFTRWHSTDVDAWISNPAAWLDNSTQ